MTNERFECLASLRGSLRRTANWRALKVASRFPNDARNNAATATLNRIVEQLEALTDSEWTALQPHFSWQSKKWIDALNEVSRRIGFSGNIVDRDGFVDSVIGLLNA
jgi:hypothetical protein